MSYFLVEERVLYSSCGASFEEDFDNLEDAKKCFEERKKYNEYYEQEQQLLSDFASENHARPQVLKYIEELSLFEAILDRDGDIIDYEYLDSYLYFSRDFELKTPGAKEARERYAQFLRARGIEQDD